MGGVSISMRVADYLDELQASEGSTVNMTHTTLWRLWGVFGREEVDQEIHRQLHIVLLDLLPVQNEAGGWEVTNSDERGNSLDVWTFDYEQQATAFIDRWIKNQEKWLIKTRRTSPSA